MLLDGILVEAKDLVNGTTVVQAGNETHVEYFHIELDAHDAILAENAWSETFVDDDSRSMFENADDYFVRYPNEAHGRRARYCAPRLDTGYEVEAIRQRLAERANSVSIAPPLVGILRGHIDIISSAEICGWAQNVDHPEGPVCLDILDQGQLIGQVLADGYREDLEKAGVGSGHHGFKFAVPHLASLKTLVVTRSLDGAVLVA